MIYSTEEFGILIGSFDAPARSFLGRRVVALLAIEKRSTPRRETLEKKNYRHDTGSTP
jgi:hypothetical protein